LIDKHRQPVIIGIGELCEQVPKDVTTASSPLDLMEQASLAACRDSGIPDKVIEALDVLAVVRTFADSTPMYPNPFGRVNNYPRAVARRIGAQPRAAIYTHAGGNTPQALVTEFSERIAAGDNSLVLLVGGEAIGATKSALKADVKLQWGDDTGGQIEDRGLGLDSIIDRQQIDNGLATAPLMYGLLENARRSAQGNSREQYADEMGKLFHAFTEVAAQHPVAAFPTAYSVGELIEVSDTNPPISAPYTRHLVAKDGVNQAAAVVLTSVARAQELGVPRDKMVFPVTGSNVHDRYLVQRPNLASSEAMRIAYQAVLESSGVSPDEISLLDLYSCFPIAVFNACEALGIDPLGGRALTLTGGLPFFGGAGNNYSMHSIVNVASQLRERRTGYGLVGANGGVLSKHAVGMYSAEPPENGWSSCDHKALQSLFYSDNCPEVDPYASGPAVIETYSIDYRKGVPTRAYIVARTIEGKRFIAHSDPGDAETPQRMHTDDPIGHTVYVTSAGPGTKFSYSRSTTASLVPKRPGTLDAEYQYCKIRRHGPVLEVTINRPDNRNCLNPQANYELEGVFDLYESAPELWVAIITGSGDKAFCAGNDLKATASGEPIWVPDGGFGGLTHRKSRRKPVIAAVNGLALGGGMEIALACDLIVASSEAVFALPEVKVGLIAGAGGIQRLARQIPQKQALEMILLGENVDAERARELGFVNWVVEPEQLLDTAREIAGRLAAVSPTSVSCSMQLLSETARMADTVEAVRFPADAINRLLTSQDMQEGVSAFAQKRKPSWRGK